MESIKSNYQVSISDLALQTNVSKITVRRDIQKLKELNVIRRVGPLKGGHWEIVQDLR